MDDQPTITLDDSDFSPEVEEQETTESAPSTEEQNTEVADDQEETEEESESEDQAEDEEESEETEPEKKPQAKNTAQNRIRSLVAEKRELQAQIEQLNSRAYTPASVEELQEQGYDPVAAQVENMKQEMAVKEFNTHVATLNSDLNTEALQVRNDFPIFNSDSEDYDPEFASLVADQYQRAAALQTDSNTGLTIRAAILPYDFYKAFAEARDSGVSKGSVKGKEAAVKELASADVSTGAAPKTNDDDPFLKGFTLNN